MKIGLRINVVEFFDVVNFLQTQIFPVLAVDVYAVQNRVLNAKIKKDLNFALSCSGGESRVNFFLNLKI